VVVAAAGNTTDDADYIPASLKRVVSVSGVKLDSTKMTNASTSYHVDFHSVGFYSMSTFIDSTSHYARTTGTSQAAPVVAATAALVRSHFPELSALQVMQKMKSMLLNLTTLFTNETKKYYICSAYF
jgi:subtilisin family serine protease